MPSFSNIPYGKQHINQDDIDAVVSVLKSDTLTQGKIINDFENAFSRYIESDYAVAVSNGTAALHLAALALNIQPGDKVLTTPITFVASANCVKYCGAEVSFCDIDPDTFLMDLDKLEALLDMSAPNTYKGLIAVDFAGYPIQMDRLKALADKYGFWIIEDACHSPGGFFIDENKEVQRCGNGNFADVAVFSFHPVKHIACGEGGMITTNRKDLFEKLMLLRTHGITRDQSKFNNSKELAYGIYNDEDDYPGWYMEMQELGYNYRLTDFQAALGLSQLKRAEAGIIMRHNIAKRYDDAFISVPKITIQKISDSTIYHAYHLYIIQVDDRSGLYSYLKKAGIYAQIHYFPVHLMPYYLKNGYTNGDYPNAEKYYNKCLSLPMYPTLTFEEQDYVIDKILAYLE